MKKALALIFALLSLSACSDKEGATHALAAQGFDVIDIQGYSYFGCGEHDAYHTAFKACRGSVCTTGVVCGGIFKGNTIRFN